MDRKIDVMIVGAQKAGTTSVLRYLGEHPQCISHAQKEFAFFLDENEYNAGYSKAFNKYFAFQPLSAQALIVAKSATLYTNEDAIKRLHEHNPNCKLILILRNPVDRTYSSFLMEKNSGSVKHEFDEIERIINHPSGWEYQVFIDYSFYEQHLQTIYKYFPENQVNIFLFEELQAEGRIVCRKIFNFLQIDPTFTPNIQIKHNVTLKARSHNYGATIRMMLDKNSTFRKLVSIFIPSHNAYKYGNAIRNLNKTKNTYLPMDVGLRQSLTDFFRPFNDKLAKLIKKDLTSWNNNSNSAFLSRCPSCHSDQFNALRKFSRHSLYRCQQCDLVFCNRIPTRTELVANYSQYERGKPGSEVTRIRVDQLLDSFSAFRKTNKILDVGCGDGLFLELALAKGWDVYGTEFDQLAVETCEKKGIKMFHGILNTANYNAESFDIIVYTEVLEHIQNQHEEIGKFHVLLRPGGGIYLTTPNFDSLSRYLLGSSWNVIGYPEHLAYFNKHSLISLFTSSGFKTSSIQSTGFSLDRCRQSGSSAHSDSSSHLDEKLRIKIEKTGFLIFLKRMVNIVFTLTNKGDSLKALFIK
jgi:2-polyprenyl-3-methyl-5-hydroxy-6-metoxy-1,4-benzoquinol methylase